MLARVWDVVKATLAVSALIAAALVSADKLDRQRSQPVVGAALVEPATTGAIAPAIRP
ncbi:MULTISPECIES: hypothetical protein [Methylobacterium]|uniref:hypothetical protein n=1 Tax=Methylobacterium TaxID=407 RepID=UPI000346D1E4|nr:MULTISPECIES: hypothetical protein [Methylobacterium]MBN4093602.1 hypothetical protein [Methylobacterium sp. OT2]UIN33941.1 hypothetical protein LXM90_23105 [Methylobacterium oryzae]SEF56872.1 hypothetical protein SAMN04488144_102205 [Methylobacterium sp. 190mf]SEN12574.1 hypothetical protein SAMN02799625_00770 [Methylobacterium sp. UNC300MFChir4.1]SFE10326.1 hypothetical protein SAMN02799627_02570 [Methylobacterium sp. 13MFTsu3.1M2]